MALEMATWADANRAFARRFSAWASPRRVHFPWPSPLPRSSDSDTRPLAFPSRATVLVLIRISVAVRAPNCCPPRVSPHPEHLCYVNLDLSYRYSPQTKC